MKRKKRKQKKKMPRFTNDETFRLAKIGGRILTKQAVANHVDYPLKSFSCPICGMYYCYNIDGKQIYCGDTCYLPKCEKNEHEPKTCTNCKRRINETKLY